MEVIGLDFQGHLDISTQETAFKLLLYTDLARPRGVARPKRALVVNWNTNSDTLTQVSDLENKRRRTWHWLIRYSMLPGL